MIKYWICMITTLCLLALQGCLFSGKEGEDGSRNYSGPADMHIVLKPAALIAGKTVVPLPVIDSVAIRVTAADMAPVEFAFSGDSLDFSLANLPAGAGRMLSAVLFKKGRALYVGTALCDLQTGKQTVVNLRCDPQFSRVSARFHLPTAYLGRIAGGSLELAGDPGTFRAQMALQGEFASFFLDEVPGNTRYAVTLTLLDSLGAILFNASQADVLLPLGLEAQWDLPLTSTTPSGNVGIPGSGETEGTGNSGNTGNTGGTGETSGTTAGVGIELQPAGESRVLPGFPAGKRRPATAGEFILSELYAAPAVKDSSTEGEWWEIFNRTADTLLLDSCRISQGRSTAVTKAYHFLPDQLLLPGRALVFGRAQARADVHYQDFTLVNTSASLLLLCASDTQVLDSLKYSSVAADSSTAVRIKDSQVSSLNPDRMGQRALPSSWCLTKMGSVDSTGLGWASPGAISQGCTE